LNLVGLLFPRINDDARSNKYQVYSPQSSAKGNDECSYYSLPLNDCMASTGTVLQGLPKLQCHVRLFVQGTNHRYMLNRKLAGPHIWSWRSGEEKTPDLQGIEPFTSQFS